MKDNRQEKHDCCCNEAEDYRALYEAVSAERDVMRARLSLLGAQLEENAEPQEEGEKRESSLRRVMWKNPVTRKIYKGFLCLQENGFRYTVHHVLEKLFVSREVKHPVYTDADYEAQRNAVFSKDIKISILVPLYNTPERFLDEMIGSVRAQTYSNWELCLADGSDGEHANVGEFVKKLAEEDTRIVYRKLEKNLGISENTNACIEMASGNYIALFDHDDILHPAALYEVMCKICNEDADFVYTDEVTFESPNTEKLLSVHHKPNFAPDNLRANNYICHFSVFAREVLDRAGMFRHTYDGSQDHDMILRLTAEAKHIVHIPKILYLWRSHPQSVAMDIGAKTYAIDAGRRAVRDSILRDGDGAEVESSKIFPAIYRIHYALRATPKVSILISNRNGLDALRRCITSILTRTTYPIFEIVIADRGSDDNELLKYYERLCRYPIFRVCRLEKDTTVSESLNRAAAEATGEYLLFLEPDTEVITPAWIEEMMMYAQRDDVAAVGAKLYYPDHLIRHAGLILGMGKDGIAGRAFHIQPKGAIGYMGRLYYSQNLSAVSRECLLVKATAFDGVGGFDKSFASYNDVDLCLRLRKAGHLIVWTPYAELFRYVSRKGKKKLSRQHAEEIERFRARWQDVLDAGDPYYNPNFSLEFEDFRLA